MVHLVQFLSGFFVLILLFAEYRKLSILKIISKPTAAFGFVLVAILYGIDSVYDKWIFGGLILSFLGDCFLLSLNKRIFLVGLVSFLIAHIFYAVAFFPFAEFTRQWMIFSLLPILLSFLFYIKIQKFLFTFKIPVLIYLIAINTMLLIGLSILLAQSGMNEWTFYHTAFLGALLFYLSDLAVARERFVEKSFLNKSWGLPFYFLGQFLIASTIVNL